MASVCAGIASFHVNRLHHNVTQPFRHLRHPYMWILVCGGNTHRSYLTAVSSVGQNRVSCCFSGCWALHKGLDVLKEETRLLRKGVTAALQARPGVGVVRACWGVSSVLTGLPGLAFPGIAATLSLSLAQVTLQMQLTVFATLHTWGAVLPRVPCGCPGGDRHQSQERGCLPSCC